MIPNSVMSRACADEIVGARFHLHKPPGICVRTLSSNPIAFTRLQSGRAGHVRTMPVPSDNAFVYQVMLKPLQSTDVWRNGKHTVVPAAAPGDTFMFDLTENPMVGFHAPFDTMRFYISQAALDELSCDTFPGRLEGRPGLTWGAKDEVLHGLAQVLAAIMENSNEKTAMLAEQVALAFHNHVAHFYAAKPRAISSHGGLAPWQLRKACDMMREKLQGDLSISELAAACGLSAGHFARAFRRMTGLPPHQWLMQQRVEQSRLLLVKGTLPLAEIALACGFVDQSHFSRVFARKQGSSPGRWRREMTA